MLFVNSGNTSLDRELDDMRAEPITTRGYAAPSVLLVGNGNIDSARQQREFQDELYELVPKVFAEKNIEQDIIAMIQASILGRIAERSTNNALSYQNRLHEIPDFTVNNADIGTIIDACKAVREGNATVGQARLAQQAYGMGATEYGSVTTIGDSRKEHLDSMWRDALDTFGDSIDLSNGYYRDTLLSVMYDDVTNPQKTKVMRIESKRQLTDDEAALAVKVRETFILDVASILDAKLNRELTLAMRNFEHPSIDDLPHIKEALDELRAGDMNNEAILARNVTLYGVSSYTEDEIKSRNDATEAQRRKVGGDALSHILELIESRANLHADNAT